MDVCKGNKREYYRFRADRFYGGIATADCMAVRSAGVTERDFILTLWRVLQPEEVAERLVVIAHDHRFGAVRISGNEPTLCKDHLLEAI